MDSRDLDLVIEGSGGSYRARLTWNGEEAVQKFVPPFERIDERDPGAVGEMLFDAVFGGPLGKLLGVARSEAGSVRLWLHTPQTSELVALPWETLRESRSEAFLALSGVALIRTIAAPSAPLTIAPRRSHLHVLLVDATSSTLAVFDRPDITVHALAGSDASTDGVRQVLQDHAPDVLHVEARTQVADVFLEAGSVRLMSLVTDTAGVVDLSRRLVERGVETVVTAQPWLDDGRAHMFIDTFYASVLDGMPFDAAVSEARRALAEAETGSPAWAAPLLFARPGASLELTAPATVPEPVEIGTVGGADNDTVAPQDQLGFRHYVTAFADLITSPHAKPPLTIGIFGSWGMGKSFLLEHIEREIDHRQAEEDAGERLRVGPRVHVVRFNAWEYSAAEVVWPALVRRIVTTLDEDVPWPWYKRWWTRLKWNLPRELRRKWIPLSAAALVLVIAIATAIARDHGRVAAALLTTLGALGVGGVVKAASNPVARWVTALFAESDYGRQIGYMEEIKQDLTTLETRLHEGGEANARITGRILILIDDLDRCEPEKAVEVLQAVNLLLNFRSFIVCLGIDARIITGAVEKHYEGLLGRAGASGYEYLDKIVQIPFRIPEPTEEEVRAFMGMQLGVEPRADDREPPAIARTGETEAIEPAQPTVAAEAVAETTVAATAPQEDGEAPYGPYGKPAYAALVSPGARRYDALGEALQLALIDAGRRPFRRGRGVWFDRTGGLTGSDITDLPMHGIDDHLLLVSRCLIVLASPEAAQSPRVAGQVTWWRERRPLETLFIVLVDGAIQWDPEASDFDWAATTALPRELSGAFATPPWYVDLRSARDAKDPRRDPRFAEAVAALDALLDGRAASLPEPEAGVRFTKAELDAFDQLVPFLRPNPRHLKRLVNVYRLVRALARSKEDDTILGHPAATIRWLVMWGQWPYTSRMMLDRLDDLVDEWGGKVPDDPPDGDPLRHLHKDVGARLDAGTRDHLDDDAESLRALLDVEGCDLSWAEVLGIRKYTVNFNPAVEEELRAVTANRSDTPGP